MVQGLKSGIRNLVVVAEERLDVGDGAVDSCAGEGDSGDLWFGVKSIIGFMVFRYINYGLGFRL
jgi:hypothetical protein